MVRSLSELIDDPLRVLLFVYTVTTKRNANFEMNFLRVKIIDFQNDYLSVALSFNKDLYNRVSSKI